MSEVLTYGGIALLKREKASLVAATGLVFERLKATSPDISLQDSLVSYKGGTWGDESIEGVGYPVLRSSNMRGKRVDVAEAAWCQIPEKQAEAFSLESGDILVTKSSGSFDLVGKAALFDDPNDGNLYLFSNFTMRLRPDREKVIPEYLAWFLRSPQALSWRFENQQTTVGLRNLQTKEYLSQVIPIPSLEIQKQVVDYLNAVETESKESTIVKLPESLDKQRQIVERFEAISARVAKAQFLREDAEQEAAALIESTLNAVVQDLQRKYETKFLEELIIEANYGTSVKCFSERENGSIPVLRIPNVASEKVTLGNLKYGTLSKSEFDKTVLKQGDILVVRTNGSADLVGRCAVVPELHEPMAFASYMIRIRCNQEIVSSAFLQLVLRQQRTTGFLFDFARTTAGQYNVSLGRLKMTKIPIPPLDEQRRIVAYLDSVQARLASLRELQSATGEELSALLPSVLDRAFKGEL